MKRLLILLSFIGLFEQVSSQVIENSSFENRTAGWNVNKSGGTEILIDSLNFFDGKRSIKISGNSKGWFWQSIPFQAKQSRPYRLRFLAFIKSNLSKGTAHLFGRAISHTGYTARYEAMGNDRVKAKQDWSLYYIDVVVDNNIKEVKVGAYFEGEGEVYFDQFDVKEIRDFHPEPLTQSIKSYTSKYLQIINENALYRDSVNFESVEKDAWQLTESAKSINDCIPVLVYTLSQLQDGHSFYWTKEEVKHWESNDDVSDFVYPNGKVINQIGYLYIPQFNSNNDLISRSFADSLQLIVRKLDQSAIRGWVIDVRNNGGGNCWPMIAGIGSLLGEGTYGYCEIRNGKQTSWSYLAGSSMEGDSIITTVTKPYEVKNKEKPIAVLIDGGTASSAEIVAISFMGLPNAKTFGSPSYGATTANNEYKLEDGSILFLTNGIYMSRNFKRFGKKIYPDVIIEPEKDDGEDKVLQEAIKWINGYR